MYPVHKRVDKINAANALLFSHLFVAFSTSVCQQPICLCTCMCVIINVFRDPSGRNYFYFASVEVEKYKSHKSQTMICCHHSENKKKKFRY